MMSASATCEFQVASSPDVATIIRERVVSLNCLPRVAGGTNKRVFHPPVWPGVRIGPQYALLDRKRRLKGPDCPHMLPTV